MGAVVINQVCLTRIAFVCRADPSAEGLSSRESSCLALCPRLSEFIIILVDAGGNPQGPSVRPGLRRARRKTPADHDRCDRPQRDANVSRQVVILELQAA